MKKKLFIFGLAILLPVSTQAVVMEGGGFRVHNGQVNPILGEATVGANVIKIGGHPIAGLGSGGGISLRQGAVFNLLSPTPAPVPTGGGGSSGGCRPGYPCDPRNQPIETIDLANTLAAIAANQQLVDRIVAGELALPGSQTMPSANLQIVIVDANLTSFEKDILRVVAAIGFGELIEGVETINLKYKIFDESGVLLSEQNVEVPVDGDLLWAQNLSLAGLNLNGKRPTVTVEVERRGEKASASAELIFNDLPFADRLLDFPGATSICGPWFDINTWWGCNWWVPVIILLIIIAVYQRHRITDLLKRKK